MFCKNEGFVRGQQKSTRIKQLNQGQSKCKEDKIGQERSTEDRKGLMRLTAQVTMLKNIHKG